MPNRKFPKSIQRDPRQIAGVPAADRADAVMPSRIRAMRAGYSEAKRAKDSFMLGWFRQQALPALETRGPAMPLWASQDATVEAHNVVGAGVGLRHTNGKFTGEICLKVFVVTKVSDSRVPENLRVPPQFEGVKTDVEEVGVIRAAIGNAAEGRPILGGAAIGHEDLAPPGKMAFGTAGGLVVVSLDGNDSLCLLSNNHVIANVNNPTGNDGIVQPGPTFGAPDPSAVVARLVSNFPPIIFGGDNLVDAAVGTTTTGPTGCCSPQFHGFGEISQQWITPAIGMSVIKSGARTGFTTGVVTGMHASVPVNYNGQSATLTDQLQITGVAGQFADEGDSGSLVVEATTMQPAGLVVAVGNGPSGPVTWANSIDNVVSALSIVSFIASPDDLQ